MKLVLMAVLLPVSVLAGLGWLLYSAPPPTAEGGVPLTPRAPVLVALDSSGNGNHGVNQGEPVMGLPGYRNTSYSFDRPGSWVQVPSNATLNPEHRDFAFSAWVNFEQAPRGSTATYDIVRKGLAWTLTGEFKVEIIGRGRVRCSAKDVEGREDRVIDGDADVVDGTWHLIGCARRGPMWSVIVDDRITSNQAGLKSIGNTMPISIGSKYGQEDVPRGRVDEVKLVIANAAIRRKVLAAATTAEQVEELLASPPVGLWRLDAKNARR